MQTVEENIKKEGAEGEIFHADMFNPPEFMKNSFNAVISLGVIEHFTNTIEAVRAHSEFLEPGGVLISKVPNLNGVLGFLLSIINADFAKTHMSLGPNELIQAYSECDLQVKECNYIQLLGINPTTGGKKPASEKNSLIYPFINCVGVKQQQKQTG